jgi:hypothetical protein
MSEPKFTKGPWRVGKPFHNTTSRQDVTPIYWDTPPCGECGRSDGEWLVAWTFPNSLKKPQYKFNAQLIAAAPDLYEALNEVETIVSMSVADDAPSLKKLRAALAKATGVK